MKQVTNEGQHHHVHAVGKAAVSKEPVAGVQTNTGSDPERQTVNVGIIQEHQHFKQKGT